MPPLPTWKSSSPLRQPVANEPLGTRQISTLQLPLSPFVAGEEPQTLPGSGLPVGKSFAKALFHRPPPGKQKIQKNKKTGYPFGHLFFSFLRFLPGCRVPLVIYITIVFNIDNNIYSSKPSPSKPPQKNRTARQTCPQKEKEKSGGTLLFFLSFCPLPRGGFAFSKNGCLNPLSMLK